MNYLNERSDRWQGVAAVLLSAVSFAFSSILYKIAYKSGLPPAQILALHTWIGAVILLGYVAFFRRHILRVNWRVLGVMALVGLVGKLGTNILVAYALLYLPASLAILLLYLYTVFVVAAGILFLHKKAQTKELLALALVVSGAFLASGIVSGVETVSLLGVLLALGSALCYTVYNILGEVSLKSISPLTVMSFTQWFASLGIFGYLGKEVTVIPWGNIQMWVLGLALAFASSLLPFYLVLFGIKRIGSGQAAILSTIELPMTYMLSAILLGELPARNQTIGGILVLAGVILLNWWQAWSASGNRIKQ